MSRRIPDGYMTVKDAADVLEVTTKTIGRMFDRGRLNRYKDLANGYNVFVKYDEVEKLLTGPQRAHQSPDETWCSGRHRAS